MSEYSVAWRGLSLGCADVYTIHVSRRYPVVSYC